MHIKFLARGTGSAREAADYLLGERDATGQPREGVAVLRGDPHQVAAVADALEFEHRYTSGVIAWAPDDEPTDAEIGAVLDDFEQTAWAGLEPDRYAWAAVLHRERGGGAHVHVLAARCDLETGRSLNIAPPGWRKTFDPLRDAFNHEHGWSRPGRSGAGQGAAPRSPRLRRGGAAQDRPRARTRAPRPDPGLPAPARRARHGAEPGRCRRRVAGSGLGGAAPGQGLPHCLGPRDRGPVAAERRAVWRRLRARTI